MLSLRKDLVNLILDRYKLGNDVLQHNSSMFSLRISYLFSSIMIRWVPGRGRPYSLQATRVLCHSQHGGRRTLLRNKSTEYQ